MPWDQRQGRHDWNNKPKSCFVIFLSLSVTGYVDRRSYCQGPRDQNPKNLYCLIILIIEVMM